MESGSGGQGACGGASYGASGGGAGGDTIDLLRRARGGDAASLDALCGRVLKRLLAEFHGKAGRDLRRVTDTVDLVQSAMVEVIKGITDLRFEEALHAWTRTIVHRKLAQKRRRYRRDCDLISAAAVERLARDAPPGAVAAAILQLREDSERLYGAMLELFREDPETMGILYGRYWEDASFSILARQYGLSERTIYRRCEVACTRLQLRLRLGAGD